MAHFTHRVYLDFATEEDAVYYEQFFNSLEQGKLDTIPFDGGLEYFVEWIDSVRKEHSYFPPNEEGMGTIDIHRVGKTIKLVADDYGEVPEWLTKIALFAHILPQVVDFYKEENYQRVIEENGEELDFQEVWENAMDRGLYAVDEIKEFGFDHGIEGDCYIYYWLNPGDRCIDDNQETMRVPTNIYYKLRDALEPKLG